MPQPFEIVRYKITVSDDQVRLSRDDRASEQAPLAECKLPTDTVHEETIRVLIDLLRENRLQKPEEFRALGMNLFALLFHSAEGEYNQIGKELTRIIDDCSNEDMQRLLRIQFEFETNQKPYSSWPWEYLYWPQRKTDSNSGGFLVDKATLILTRFLRLTGVRDMRVKQPLKILFAASSPHALGVGYKVVLEQIEAIEKAMHGRLQLYKLLPAQESADGLPAPGPQWTFGEFIRSVRSVQPHVIHFIGHGIFLPEARFIDQRGHPVGEGEKGQYIQSGGALAFMREDGSTHWVDEDTLANQLDPHRSIRLIFLQACESGESKALSNYQVISGVANRLAQKGIPAVIGMHYRVENRIANTFARSFYKELAEWKPVELALNEARQNMALDTPDWRDRGAFGLPVIYLRSSGELLDPTEEPAPDAKPTKDVLRCAWCGTLGAENYCICGASLRCHKCQAPVTVQRRRCGTCNTLLEQPDAARAPLAQPADTFDSRAAVGATLPRADSPAAQARGPAGEHVDWSQQKRGAP